MTTKSTPKPPADPEFAEGCKFPMFEDKPPRGKFKEWYCGAPCLSGQVYCAEHQKIAYNKNWVTRKEF